MKKVKSKSRVLEIISIKHLTQISGGRNILCPAVHDGKPGTPQGHCICRNVPPFRG
ncbi:hypothetical protein J8L98_12095 [Pseudoalteromonas sp. MMG013]|uniref:hypothetical protein n=1 Tax=Pseudoalteromonas sp. MMG013 TaxID=2822687 RepID=UPI001B39162B|nr:hypothetical protein [Pseudoalteromonas sp. MMG013]MBQ4862429.1 hypothetical protein [Pseudoalteromonas sp. MMG013]